MLFQTNFKKQIALSCINKNILLLGAEAAIIVHNYQIGTLHLAKSVSHCTVSGKLFQLYLIDQNRNLLGVKTP